MRTNKTTLLVVLLVVTFLGLLWIAAHPELGSAPPKPTFQDSQLRYTQTNTAVLAMFAVYLVNDRNNKDRFKS